MEKTYTHFEIVKKLIGSVRPVGSSHTDSERLENLKQLCSLANEIIQEIDNVAIIDSYENSVIKMSSYAREYIDSLDQFKFKED